MKWIVLPLVMGTGALVAFGNHVLAGKSDPSIALAKDTWECSQSILKQDVTYVMSDGVMVPATLQDLVCVQYTKRGYQ